MWAGIEKGNDTIIKTFQSIENNLKSESFYKKENYFHPHLTLARIKYIKHPVKFNEYIRNISIDQLTYSVKKIDLMESILHESGPVYKIIGSFILST